MSAFNQFGMEFAYQVKNLMAARAAEFDRLDMNLRNRQRWAGVDVGTTPELAIDNAHEGLGYEPDCFPGLWHIRRNVYWATPDSLEDKVREGLAWTCRGGAQCRPSVKTEACGRHIRISIQALVQYRPDYLRAIEEPTRCLVD